MKPIAAGRGPVPAACGKSGAGVAAWAVVVVAGAVLLGGVVLLEPGPGTLEVAGVHVDARVAVPGAEHVLHVDGVTHGLDALSRELVDEKLGFHRVRGLVGDDQLFGVHEKGSLSGIGEKTRRKRFGWGLEVRRGALVEDDPWHSTIHVIISEASG